MTRVYDAALEASLAACILIPLLLLYHKNRIRSIKTTVAYILFCAYLSGIYAVVGLPNLSYIRFDPNLHLIPFQGMLPDVTATVLNILLFVPLGVFLPLLWPSLRHLRQTLLWGSGLSLTIELLQMFSGRATDVNDLITNTTGTLAGFCLGLLLIQRIPVLGCNRPQKELPLLLGLSFGVMFLFEPFIWNLLYYA